MTLSLASGSRKEFERVELRLELVDDDVITSSDDVIAASGVKRLFFASSTAGGVMTERYGGGCVTSSVTSFNGLLLIWNDIISSCDSELIGVYCCCEFEFVLFTWSSYELCVASEDVADVVIASDLPLLSALKGYSDVIIKGRKKQGFCIDKLAVMGWLWRHMTS